ncbi:MAG: hypothetical protein IPO08_22005 [Xanthomonadales bacterium]|nr:hypothetical protein [Xanthomonadales bacterium]
MTRTTRTQMGLLGLVILLGTGILVFTSIKMNWEFGYSLGKTPQDAELMGLLSVGSDLIKIATLSAAFIFAVNRRWALSFLASVMFAVALSYSVLVTAGYWMTNRTDTIAERVRTETKLTSLQEERQTARDDLAVAMSSGTPRAITTIDAELAQKKAETVRGKKGKVLGTVGALAGGCVDPQPFLAKQCSAILELQRERTASEARHEAIAKVERIDASIAALAVTGVGDPQATALAKTLNLDPELVVVLLAFLPILPVELATSGGLLLTLALWGLAFRRADDPKQQPKVVPGGAAVDFTEEELDRFEKLYERRLAAKYRFHAETSLPAPPEPQTTVSVFAEPMGEVENAEPAPLPELHVEPTAHAVLELAEAVADEDAIALDYPIAAMDPEPEPPFERPYWMTEEEFPEREDNVIPLQVHPMTHRFVTECLERAGGERVTATNLQFVYAKWCDDMGEKQRQWKLVSRDLILAGFNKVKRGSMMYENVAFTSYAQELLNEVRVSAMTG